MNNKEVVLEYRKTTISGENHYTLAIEGNRHVARYMQYASDHEFGEQIRGIVFGLNTVGYDIVEIREIV